MHLDYFRKGLQGLAPLCTFPTDFPRPPGTPGTFNEIKVVIPLGSVCVGGGGKGACWAVGGGALLEFQSFYDVGVLVGFI